MTSKREKELLIRMGYRKTGKKTWRKIGPARGKAKCSVCKGRGCAFCGFTGRRII